MKYRIFFLCSICLFSSLLSSTIWEVNQDGSGDFTIVQSGINEAANNDTVLVYPGIYYENLEIIDKFITLASLYLTTGDEFYIPYTILDGNQTSSVIRLENTSLYWDVIISGFTIQHGIGYRYGSDEDRAGGGIYALESILTIKKCYIQNNSANNGGGGIVLLWSDVFLSNNTIRFNESSSIGGGIAIAQYSNMYYDNVNLNNIYLNYAGKGNDISLGPNTTFQEIIVDTFTVVNPDDNYYFIYPTPESGLPTPGHFSTNIQHGYVEQVDQDVYVSADGDDSNSGLSPSDPLRSIAFAMVKVDADTLHQNTVHIANGIYSESHNNQIFPLQIKSYVDIIGDSMENTILDGENQYGFFVGKSCQKSYNIQNLSLLHNNNQVNIGLSNNSNASFNNIISENGYCEILFANTSDVTLNNVTQINTTGGRIYFNGGLITGDINVVQCKMMNNYGNIPIYCTNTSHPSLDVNFNVINSLVSDNLEIGSEWAPRTNAILVDWAVNLNLINSTLGNNESLSTGAAIQLADYAEGSIINSIIYGNTPYNLCLNGSINPVTLFANNSLIGSGLSGILNMGTNIINWDDLTMLDEDPLWLGTGYEYPYALSINSPCIDTGTLELPYGVEIPAYDLAGNPRVMGSNIDMGAYEYPGNAAPIYLEVNNENLSWQIPPGFSPDSYNVYLDDEFQTNVSAFQMEYQLHNLIISQNYKAGVSAVYAGEETAIIPKYFTYNPVGIEENTQNSPLTSHLSNYPNPFNPTTTISFNVAQSYAFATLEIFNIKGQKVKTLVNAKLASGNYNITWNGKDTNNKRVSSGEYFAKLKIDGKEEEFQKMILLK